MVIVTGPTGSGKSTALAAMLEYINTRYPLNIITIEDPIEYQYSSKLCLIQQREVGRDVGEFSVAVRSAMRESPDVILVGEIRDYETLKACLQAAETGHLVFGDNAYQGGSINAFAHVGYGAFRRARGSRDNAGGCIPSCHFSKINILPREICNYTRSAPAAYRGKKLFKERHHFGSKQYNTNEPKHGNDQLGGRHKSAFGSR